MSRDTTSELAASNDIAELVKLVNSAYRGEAAKSGWTHEADLIEGEVRIDELSLTEMLSTPGTVMLLAKDNGVINGCVLLEKQGTRMYLGMLSVKPTLQAQGTGKKLLELAEEYTMKQGIASIIMSVITTRHELLAWYNRRGYFDNGERKPFPDNAAFGIPKQKIEFAVLEKKLPLIK